MDTEHTGVWALVVSEGKRFLGRISRYLGERYAIGVSTEEWVEVNPALPSIQEAILLTRLICLSPVLDFVSFDQPVMNPNQKMGFNKTPIVLPFDYTKHQAKLTTKWSTIMFLDDLHEDDKKFYMEMIEDGMSKVPKKAAERPLLVTASAGIPQGLGRNGGR